MKVVVGYPTDDEELGILYRMGSVAAGSRGRCSTPAALLALQARAREVFVHHALAEYVVRLVLATRDPARFGAAGRGRRSSRTAPARAPRSAWSRPARALALLRGRDYVLPADVLDLAPDVLAHRLVLSFDAVADGVAAETRRAPDRRGRAAAADRTRRRSQARRVRHDRRVRHRRR